MSKRRPRVEQVGGSTIVNYMTEMDIDIYYATRHKPIALTARQMDHANLPDQTLRSTLEQLPEDQAGAP